MKASPWVELEDAEYAVVAKWKMFKARSKLKDTIGGTVSQWLKKNRQSIPVLISRLV